MATHRFKIEGKDYEVEVNEPSGSTVQVTVNGKSYQVELDEGAPTRPEASRAPAPQPSRPAAAAPPPATPAAGDAQSGEVRAPISGIVLNVAVSKGQQVQQGAILLVLEAMKMENEIFAPCNGTIAEIAVQPQQDVVQGDLLVKIEGA